MIETLTPTDARTEDRAMTIGQRVDFSTDTAWLGQLFFPSGYAWDSGGEWYYTSAQILMTLTSTYLLKISGNSNVAMPTPSLSYIGASSGNLITPQTFSPTPTGMYTTSRVIGSPNHPVPTIVYVQHGWAGVIENSLQGSLTLHIREIRTQDLPQVLRRNRVGF